MHITANTPRKNPGFMNAEYARLNFTLLRLKVTNGFARMNAGRKALRTVSGLFTEKTHTKKQNTESEQKNEDRQIVTYFDFINGIRMHLGNVNRAENIGF